VASVLKPPMAAAPPVQKPVLRILGQAVVYVSQHSDYSKCAAVRPPDAVCDPVRHPLSHPTPLGSVILGTMRALAIQRVSHGISAAFRALLSASSNVMTQVFRKACSA
jgi:hypothetical protein